MTIVTDNCHNLNSDLQTAVSLVRRDIWFDLIKVFSALIIIVLIVKYSNKIHITFYPVFTSDNLIAILTFFLNLKIINDLRDSSKKLLKLKKLRDNILKDYPKAEQNSCENQTCIMMKQVMGGTFN